MKWINIKDKLPEVEKDVLVSVDYQDGSRVTEVGYLTQSGEIHVFNCKELIEVLHWMPLPNPLSK